MKNYLIILFILIISCTFISSCKIQYNTSEPKLFYVGEGANENNNFTPRIKSFFDENWLINYGGVDFPERRNGIYPADFVPKENPLYVGLPNAKLEDKNKMVEVVYAKKKCKAEVKDKSQNNNILISPALRDCLGFVNGSVEWRIMKE